MGRFPNFNFSRKPWKETCGMKYETTNWFSCEQTVIRGTRRQSARSGGELHRLKTGHMSKWLVTQRPPPRLWLCGTEGAAAAQSVCDHERCCRGRRGAPWVLARNSAPLPAPPRFAPRYSSPSHASLFQLPACHSASASSPQREFIGLASREMVRRDRRLCY